MLAFRLLPFIFLVLWGCTRQNSKENISLDKLPVEVLDFIHIPTVDPLFRAADSLKYLRQYKESADLFEDLLSQSPALSKIENAYLFNQYCYTLLHSYQYERAGELLDSINSYSEEISANRADWHLSKGLFHLEEGKEKEAAYHLKQAEVIYQRFYGPNHQKRLESLLSLAEHYYNGIRLDSLQYCLDQADRIIVSDTTQYLNKQQFYLIQGIAERYGKGHEAGLLQIDLAIEEARSSFADPIFLARCYAERSQLLRKLDKIDLAREALQKALDLWKTSNEYPNGLLNIYEALALQGIKERDSTSFFQVLANIRTTYSEFPDAQTHPDCLLAYYSYKIGDYPRTIRLYRTLIESYRLEEWDNRAFFDEAFFVLSESYRKQHKLDSAIYYNQLSINHLIDDRPEALDVFYNGTSLEGIDKDFRHTLTIFLSKRPICQYESFRQKPGQNQDSLRQAISAFIRLDSLFFHYADIKGEDQLLEFAEEHFNSTYDYAIEACFAAYQLWQDPIYLEYGHQFIERIKYAGMARGIFRRQFRATLPDYHAQKLTSFELEIDHLKRRRSKELDRLKGVTNQRIYQLEHERQDFVDSLRTWFPQLPVLRTDIPIPSLKSLQQQAEYPIIQYHHANDYISCIIIRPDSLILRQWPYDSDLDTIATDYLELLRISSNSSRKSAFAEFTASSYQLYEQLIAPVESALIGNTKVLICPDTNFPQIPYESLIRNPSIENSTNYAGLHYLINDWNISYAHSLRSFDRSDRYDLPSGLRILGYAFSEQHTQSTASNRVGSSTLVPLPGAASELMAIDQQYGTSNHTVELHYGSEATLKQFRTDIYKGFDIIHLGLHANSNADNRWDNEIFFPNDSASAVDTLLGLELEYLPLSDALIVLSACNTATGTELEAEGVYSLARSCIIAGAKEVVASLWTIPDKQASEVMAHFYHQLEESGNTSISLHRAKLQYISKQAPAQAAFPGYWAGLVLFR